MERGTGETVRDSKFRYFYFRGDKTFREMKKKKNKLRRICTVVSSAILELIHYTHTRARIELDFKTKYRL